MGDFRFSISDLRFEGRGRNAKFLQKATKGTKEIQFRFLIFDF
jgi:hypothetical protein